MSETAVAVVTVTVAGKAVAGTVCYLHSPSLPTGFLFAITNDDGYAVWPSVPVPFSGTLQLSGAAAAYGRNGNGEPVTVSGSNVTIRVGPSPSNPQDVQLPACVPFKKGSALPAPPSRDVLCGIKCSFQGLTVPTTNYGNMPWFEPALGWDAFQNDHEAVYDAKYAAGDTHVNLAVSSQYDEPHQAYAGIAGKDYSNNLPALRQLITATICAGASRGLPNGFMILLAMAGDGMGFDPAGLTYGFDWLMANFERIYASLRGDNGEGPDLTPWIIPMPGYDGVVPGWQPFTCVNQYVEMARIVVGPNRALGIELSAGYNSWSGEANDWATPDGQMFDVILSEFPYVMGPPQPIPPQYLNAEGWLPTPPLTPEQRAPWDQVWQIAGALIQPFNRPSNMPVNDYPNGIPYRLGDGTPRGQFFYIAFEYDAYGWVRYCPIEQVIEHRNYLKALGCQYVG